MKKFAPFLLASVVFSLFTPFIAQGQSAGSAPPVQTGSGFTAPPASNGSAGVTAGQGGVNDGGGGGFTQPNVQTDSFLQTSGGGTSASQQSSQFGAPPGTEIGCSFTAVVGENGSKAFALCVSSLFYWIAWLTGGLAYMGAYFFSYAVQISLNSAAYSLNFISEGWTIMRDVANMTFLFLLIYIAMTIIFRAETREMMQMLAAVIVVALLVNFSFFFSRVVIDAGNIFALQFYNSIDVQGAAPIGNGVKDLSAGIMGAVQIHSVYGTESFRAFQQSNASAFTTFLMLSMVYLGAAAMYVILFFAFIHVGIKFILRVVGLWLVIIASPIAFICRVVKKDYFKTWLQSLIGFSLYPAIFLFIFLVLSKMTAAIAQGNLVDQVFASALRGLNNQQDFTIIPGALANIGIRMGFIIAMLYFGLKVADKIVAEGNKMAEWSMGTAGKGIFSAGGFLGRRSFGAVGGLIGSNKNLRGSTNFLARKTWQTGDWLSKRSYDARGIKGVTAGLGLAGIKAGDAQGKGGIYAVDKERTDRREKAQKEQKEAQRDTQNKKDVAEYISLKEKSLTTLEEQKNLARLEATVQDFGKRELSAMSKSDIEKIAGVLKESQRKMVEENEKFDEATKERITAAWHNGSGDAPLQKAGEIVNKLRDIDSTLKTTVTKELKRFTTSGEIINATNVSAMVKEVTTIMAQTNKNLDVARRAGTDTTDLHQDIHNLREMLNRLDKLGEERKKVPMNVGGRENEGEFKVK